MVEAAVVHRLFLQIKNFFLEDKIMSVKVAINGFGRIGRLAFRQMFGAELTAD